MKLVERRVQYKNPSVVVWIFSGKTQSFYLGSLQDLSEIFLRILGRSFSLKINRSRTL